MQDVISYVFCNIVRYNDDGFCNIVRYNDDGICNIVRYNNDGICNIVRYNDDGICNIVRYNDDGICQIILPVCCFIVDSLVSDKFNYMYLYIHQLISNDVQMRQK